MTESGQEAWTSWPIQLDAPAVAAAPILGYELGSGVGDGKSRPPAVRITRPWIVTEESPVKIDVDTFAYNSPFDELLFPGATTSTELESLREELTTSTWTSWANESQLSEYLKSTPPVPALRIVGDSIAALVWADGVVIRAEEPIATGLVLFFFNFSELACRAFVYAKPTLLKKALDWLPASVRELYVPNSEQYVGRAYHEVAVERQRRLKSLKSRFKLIRDDPDE